MLVVIYSALLGGLIGCGGLIARALRLRAQPRVFIRMGLGMSCLHALTLLGVPIVGVLTAVLSMAALEVVLSRARLRPVLAAADLKTVALVFGSTLPLWAYFMARPLWAFDARNVWLFAGRIIHGTGRFPFDAWQRLYCHWGPDYRLNLNADYPKLVGALGAAVATMAGYWNEYLPKLGILLLHTLALIGFIELGWRWRAVALNLVLTVAGTYRYFFDSASLDIHVAMLMLIALLCLGRARAEREGTAPLLDGPRRDHLAMAVAAIAVASQLKYEGRALTAIILACALVTRAVSWRELWRLRLLFLAFLPTVVWLVEVRLFKVPSYLQYSGGLPVALTRARTDLFGVILPGIVQEPMTLIGLAALAAALLAARFLQPRPSWSAVARDPAFRTAILGGLGYATALIAVYLVTPYPQVVHQMQSSVTRACLPIQAAFVAAALRVLELRRADC